MRKAADKAVAPRNTGDPKSLARKPKTKAEALGQVLTPPPIAQAMLTSLGVARAPVGATLLDPCVGPSTFPAALLALGVSHISVHAYDLDPMMVAATKAWAQEHGFNIIVKSDDYLQNDVKAPYDFAVLNPPYLRQEWIKHKENYRQSFRKHYGVNVPGTSNLYVYFVVKALNDLKDGGRMACIVYDSWQSTHYGKWLQNYLRTSCRSITLESVPALPFDGILIDATIILAEKGQGNETSILQKRACFTSRISGLSQIEQLFSTRRGLRLKQANFFLTELRTAQQEGAIPFVKKIGLIPGFTVPSDHPEAVLLISPTHGNERTERTLRRRLALARLNPHANISILTWWRERNKVWNQHGTTQGSPLLFNYYLRRRPRHIYNPIRLFSDNFYGLTPLEKKVPVLAWLAALNSTLSVIGILEQARNQGAGLAKLQLFEYRKARIVDLRQWPCADIAKMNKLGQALVRGVSPIKVIASIDKLIASVLGNSELRPDALCRALADADHQARKPKK